MRVVSIAAAGSLLAISIATAQQAPAQPKTIPAGYRVETVPMPKGVAFGVSGMSFAGDGTLYVCSREGQVWTLSEGDWRLFADGLHEPLGLYVDPRTNQVFAVQRPELTELIDDNGDGRADRFRTVCAAWGLTDNYHEYAYGLVRDAKGNFYGTLNTTLSWPGWAGSDRWDVARVHDSKMGRAAKFRGWSFRVTPAGTFEPWSSGLRSPCGVGWGPNRELLCTDNQGDWVATSCLHVMDRGDFHGHPSSLTDHPDYRGVDLDSIPIAKYAEMHKRPAAYFPHGDLANSPGEPVLDTSKGRFGPFAGQLFIGDQTRSNIFRVALEEVSGAQQGCAINFIDHLQSGIVRSRFAADGSLWVGQTGRGWGSRGPVKFGLQRLVWDGENVPFAMHSVSLTKKGFDLRFTRAIAPEPGTQAATYKVERWRYKHMPRYGSPKFDQGKVEVRDVRLSADGLTASLQMQLEAGFVYRFQVLASGADGGQLSNDVAWYTLNRLRK